MREDACVIAAPDRIRNLAILAHINAGKTTLTERILFDTGRRGFMGAVEEGTAAMDFLPEEQRRGISISAALASVEWRGCLLNLVDTPGHVDFAAEVERTLRVVDGAVVLVDGVRGVESQTEMVWRQAQRRRLAALVFVNKLDRPTADWARSLQSLRDRLQLRVLAAVVPLVDAEGIAGLVDAISGRRIEWRAGGQPQAAVAEARAQLVEAAAETDPAVLEAFVLDRPVSDEVLIAALRRAVCEQRVVLAYAGSALCDRGVDFLLDGVRAFLPGPIDAGGIVGADGATRPPSAAAPFCGLVFRTLEEAGDGVAIVRVYSGTVRAGDVVAVAGAGGDRVVAEVARVLADDREPLPAGEAGDIVALVGLGGVPGGATLHAPEAPIRLEPARFGSPVVTVAIEPRHPDDRARIEAAVLALAGGDPTLEARLDAERDVLLLAGMGELHVEVATERLLALVGDCFRTGRPEVAGRTTVAAPASAEAEWRVPEVGAAARVVLRIEAVPGLGPARVRRDESVSARAAAEVAAALTEGLAAGLWTRWPLIDAELHLDALHVEAPDGVDPATLAVDAARIAARRLFAQATVVQLEPVVEVEVECPAEWLSAVLGDLRGKATSLKEVEVEHGRARARAVVSLRRMLGYSTRLRSLTRGLGAFFLRPAGLQPAGGDA